MGTQVLTKLKLYIDGWDLSGDMRAIALNYGAETPDATTFNATSRARDGGLKTLAFEHEGLWNGGTDLADEVLFNRIGLADVPVTIAPQQTALAAGTEGESGFFFNSIHGAYSFGGAVGDMLAFNVSGEATGDLIRGTILLNAVKTASGNGTAFQVGAVLATEKLHAILHVIAASGSTPTLDVKVQSDDASGFASPTDQITFTQKTAIGSQLATPVSGAITDDWWRVNFTIGGGSPSWMISTSTGT